MANNMKNLLGKYNWYGVTHLEDGFASSTQRMDACWRDPDATVEQLLATLDDYDRNRVILFCLEQWQKVGRSIVPVKMKQIQVKVPVPAQAATEVAAE